MQDKMEKLLEQMTIIGLVELPDSMFVSKPKIIIVLQKKVMNQN